MIIKAVDEYNEGGHLVYADNFIGAYARGKTKDDAFSKLPIEISSYRRWINEDYSETDYEIVCVQEKLSELQICDADSDVIFDSELNAITSLEFEKLKSLALKSARDFLTLYSSILNKDSTSLTPRKTFYGDVPITANQMYEHTKNVNNYYFNEIGVDTDNDGDILSIRKKGFELLEQKPDFLQNKLYVGSYDESWSLRKVIRRFVWHDRIHAKAMLKMAKKLPQEHNLLNPFCF